MPLAHAETAEQMNAEFEFDEASFLAKIPYKLTPTSLKGVYAHVGPPDDFDPNTATQHELVQHGILVRKPTAKDPAHVHQAWESFFSRKLLSKDRIVPEFEVHIGKSHQMKRRPKQKTAGSFTSDEWSGAGATTGSWTSIVGSWTVPLVNQPVEPLVKEHGWNSVAWIGLDGWGSNYLLQAGTGQVFYPAGKPPVYFAFYEWFTPPQPNSPPYIYEIGISNMPIAPGDQITCTVQYVGTTAGSIALINRTSGQHFAITLAPPPTAALAGNSYEWIMEAPDGGESVSSLPRFTPVVFSAATVCGPNGVTANPASGDITNIVSASGQILTQATVSTDTLTIVFAG